MRIEPEQRPAVEHAGLPPIDERCVNVRGDARGFVHAITEASRIGRTLIRGALRPQAPLEHTGKSDDQAGDLLALGGAADL